MKKIERLKIAYEKLADEKLVTGVFRDEVLSLLSETIEEEEKRLEEKELLKNAGKPWTDSDVSILLAVFNKCGKATSWEREKATMNMAAYRLKRTAGSIKRKATELGKESYINYWLNYNDNK